MGHFNESETLADPETGDAKPASPDTGTLLVKCTDWRDPMFRVHGGGIARLNRPDAETHLDWGILEPLTQLRVVLRGTLRLRMEAETVDLDAGAASRSCSRRGRCGWRR